MEKEYEKERVKEIEQEKELQIGERERDIFLLCWDI